MKSPSFRTIKENETDNNIMWNSIIQAKTTPPGGLEPPTFRLTAERASQLRHGGDYIQ